MQGNWNFAGVQNSCHLPCLTVFRTTAQVLTHVFTPTCMLLIIYVDWYDLSYRGRQLLLIHHRWSFLDVNRPLSRSFIHWIKLFGYSLDRIKYRSLNFIIRHVLILVHAVIISNDLLWSTHFRFDRILDLRGVVSPPSSGRLLWRLQNGWF